MTVFASVKAARLNDVSDPPTTPEKEPAPAVAEALVADVVKDAPIPLGGTLKVISGQKLVLESAVASANDKLYAYCTSANDVDAIASVLEDVS